MEHLFLAWQLITIAGIQCSKAQQQLLWAELTMNTSLAVLNDAGQNPSFAFVNLRVEYSKHSLAQPVI